MAQWRPAIAKIDYDTMQNLARVVAWGHGTAIAFLAPNAGGYIDSVFGAVGTDLDTLYQN